MCWPRRKSKMVTHVTPYSGIQWQKGKNEVFVRREGRPTKGPIEYNPYLGWQTGAVLFLLLVFFILCCFMDKVKKTFCKQRKNKQMMETLRYEKVENDAKEDSQCLVDDQTVEITIRQDSYDEQSDGYSYEQDPQGTESLQLLPRRHSYNASPEPQTHFFLGDSEYFLPDVHVTLEGGNTQNLDKMRKDDRPMEQRFVSKSEQLVTMDYLKVPDPFDKEYYGFGRQHVQVKKDLCGMKKHASDRSFESSNYELSFDHQECPFHRSAPNLEAFGSTMHVYKSDKVKPYKEESRFT